ncbi:MAG: wax ester/triacylglycerol synthase family O-acyltransferase, partial [Solirubrobacterales bacterium]|nr:wax ester/triacylglycerol synthase family O-acyltransferase [Solirubrobacterales bacterium]
MAQRHLDRLSALDASFLTRDGMHTGGVLVLEGAVPSVAEFSDFLAARLSPRFRQKVLDAPGGPRWADDPAFDIGFHVRPAALPSPAGDSELRTFVAQVAGQQLDRKRPLWECWLVECGADHFAVVFKSHLILGALDLLAGTGASDAGSSAHATPSQRELLVRGAVDAVGFGVGLAGRTLDAALHPTGTLREAVGVAAGVGELALASLNPAPASPLNVPIGRHRRYELVRHELDDYVRVKSVFGTTVNDVVLAVLTGGLRQWLLSRAVSLEGLELRALLPVHGLVRAPQT